VFKKFKSVITEKFTVIIQKNSFVLLLFVLVTVFSNLQSKNDEVGIDEKLGNYIPLDLSFVNEKSEKVLLKDLVNKPTILALVYYNCPAVCNPLLNGLSEVVDKIDLNPGTDFNIITLSFNHKENAFKALKWKREHLVSMKRTIPDASWRFLTGDSASIRKLTNSVGFYFKQDTDSSFLHFASLIILSEDGKITRYIFGTEFLPFDIKMALIEAQKGEARPTINKILTFCYSYDRQGNKYVLDFKRIAGAVVLLSAIIFFTTLIIKGKKNRK
jgi:protein SCO1/2